MPAGPVRPPKVVRPWHPAPASGPSIWSRIQDAIPLLRASTWTGASTTGRDPVAKAISGWQSQQAALNKARKALVVVSPPAVSRGGAPAPVRSMPSGGGTATRSFLAPRSAPKPKIHHVKPPAKPKAKPKVTPPAATVSGVPIAPVQLPLATPGNPVTAAAPSSGGLSTGTLLLAGGAALGGAYWLSKRKGK